MLDFISTVFSEIVDSIIIFIFKFWSDRAYKSDKKK